MILCCIQSIVSQKINLSYKVQTTDSLLMFQYKALSDKSIQTKANSIFQKFTSNKNLIYIEDNINRRFEKTNFKHKTYYSKLLTDGYFKLYELKVNNDPIYLAYSKNDSVVLEKKDYIVNDTLKIDRKYINKLIILAKDHPKLWEKARKVEFRKNDLQDFISVLDNEYPSTNRTIHDKNEFNFLSLALKGFYAKNKTDIMLDVFMTHYFINISPNFSLRYGLKFNNFRQTEFFPESFTGLVLIDQNLHVDSIFYYRDHFETMTANIFEAPLAVNFEITNSIFTPYFNAGLSPTLYFRKITRTDSDKIERISRVNLNVFTAFGFKLKLSDNFNIISESKYDLLKGLSLSTGVEYYFKL